MMKTIKSTSPSAILLTMTIVLLSEADVHVIAYSIPQEILQYLKNIPRDIINNIFNRPSNDFGSIQYFLYTPSNPKVKCYIEPNPEDFDHCTFNSSYATKFLIPGFNTSVNPGNRFEDIKDTLLNFDEYNVIILNYTTYSYPPFILATFDLQPVGQKVADMIKFLVDYAGVNPQDVHLIGHSLGGLLVGVIGRKVPNLGRITGLDPGGLNPNDLRPTDANFVDVIHTSNLLSGSGMGIYHALGDVDFYPNGGEIQPGCEYGDTFLDRDGSLQKIQVLLDKSLCNHVRALDLFLNSIENCEFLATYCSSYERYKQGKCSSESHPTDRMGLHSTKIEGLVPRSKFFLETGLSAPYCKTK